MSIHNQLAQDRIKLDSLWQGKLDKQRMIHIGHPKYGSEVLRDHSSDGCKTTFLYRESSDLYLDFRIDPTANRLKTVTFMPPYFLHYREENGKPLKWASNFVDSINNIFASLEEVFTVPRMRVFYRRGEDNLYKLCLSQDQDVEVASEIMHIKLV